MIGGENLHAVVATQDAMDKLDAQLAKAISDICRRAGGENDDPPPVVVRDIFREHGLLIFLRPPSTQESRPDDRG